MYTATTEIYTYLHTLSLHGALPIFRGLGILGKNTLGQHQKAGRTESALQGMVVNKSLLQRMQFTAVGQAFHGLDLATMGLRRSEEHTSEIQSLMRISYGVFCLQKKNRRQRGR